MEVNIRIHGMGFPQEAAPQDLRAASPGLSVASGWKPCNRNWPIGPSLGTCFVKHVHTLTIHVWDIYLHLVDFYGKSR